jgi:hypothetical protein
LQQQSIAQTKVVLLSIIRFELSSLNLKEAEDFHPKLTDSNSTVATVILFSNIISSFPFLIIEGTLIDCFLFDWQRYPRDAIRQIQALKGFA